MGRKRSCSWPLFTSGRQEKKIWRSISSSSSTLARSNIKWGYNETKSLLEVLENRLKKGMIWVDPGSNKLADQVNHKSNTAFNDTHIKALVKLLRHVYKYWGKDIASVRSLQASLNDVEWNKFLYVFGHVKFRRGTFRASTSSHATNEMEARAGAAVTNGQVESSLEENSVGTPMYGPRRLYNEASEKLEQLTLPREFHIYADATLFDERFLMPFMSIPHELVFKFLNYRVMALRKRGFDIFNIK